MARSLNYITILSLLLFIGDRVNGQSSFVQRSQHQFILNGKPYYYIGANYWYGGFLGLEKDASKGIERLREELDFLKSKGVNNLRVLAAAEGSGMVNGVERVGPPVQPMEGKFDVSVLQGLDVLLHEMSKRDMKAILFLSNNWEWSGGFLQYLRWNGLISDTVFRRKLNWDEMRDYVSAFYSCTACTNAYLKQVDLILNHVNKISGRKYLDDPVIMAWELANEPRPMRPAASAAYRQWIADAAAFIKSKDKNHLVAAGTEGQTGTESMALFEEVHAGKNIDYLTIHIWPKNWGWFKDTSIQKDIGSVISNTENYVRAHVAVAKKLNKPLVIEEFGLPRDNHSFNPSSTVTLRNRYYNILFSLWQQNAAAGDVLAGVNFWTFGGITPSQAIHTSWKTGDPYIGDPPMEEQGLNSVFHNDNTTWDLISSFTGFTGVGSNDIQSDWPADRSATKETVSLYKNLKKLLSKGIMFGHQDDLAYGVGWKYVDGKSDIKEVAGDYPAVYGWELGNIEHDLPVNLDSVPFDKMRRYIMDGYKRGGVITISWHGDNPLNNESAWDTTHGAVASILPGGEKNELYKSWLNKIAAFFQSLHDEKGKAIPVLFRPFHELTGNWFWWCKNTCTPEEFKSLWRFTVNYLRNEKGIHNLLYVYNTADFITKKDFLDRYPGDDVVDIVSFDAYQYKDPQKDNSFALDVDRRLRIIEEVATEKNKIPALAETGYEAIPYTDWWTQTLWKAVGDHRISYVLVWRNAGLMGNGHLHYYAPYKGQASAEDFKRFYGLDKTLFEKDVAKEKLYE